MATWADRSGKSTGDAAWISSPQGWWMSHVLLADGDEVLKAKLCAALVGGADAKLWNPAKAAAKAGIPSPELCSRILEDARCG